MVLTAAAAGILCALFFCSRGLMNSRVAGFMLGERKPYSFIRFAQAVAWVWISVALIFSAAAGFVVGRG